MVKQSDKHIIKKQILQVKVPRSVSSWDIQQRLSDLSKEQLIETLGVICDDLSVADKCLRVSEIRLDLGTIQLKDLEEEFIHKTEEAFRKAIAELEFAEDLESSLTVRKTELEAIVYFLKFGILPWWADVKIDLNEALKRVIAAESSTVKKLLLPALKDQIARLRLLSQFDFSTVEEMIFKSVPDGMKIFRRHHKDLRDFLTIKGAKNPNLPSVKVQLLDAYTQAAFSMKKLSSFSEKKWLGEILIKTLESNSAINKVSFIRLWYQLSQSPVAKISISEDQLKFTSKLFEEAGIELSKRELKAMKRLNHALGEQLKVVFDFFKTFFGDKDEERWSQEKGEKAKETRDSTQSSAGLADSNLDRTGKSISRPEGEAQNPATDDYLKDLPYARENEVNPDKGDKPVINREEEEDSETIKTSQRDSQAEQTSVQGSGQSSARKSNVEMKEESDSADSKSLSSKQEKQSYKDERVNEESEANRSKDYLLSSGDDISLNKDHSENVNSDNENSIEQTSQRSISSSEETNDEKRGQSQRERTEPRGHAHRSFISGGSLDQDYDEMWVEEFSEKVEEIYITNSGLVLLWPYLSRFFDHLKLTKQGDFLSDKARSKSLYVLQHLVEPFETAFEQRLFLNKLLCEWPLDQYVGKPQNISDRINTESEEFLTAVIANWSILKNTSTEAFRSTFLKRDGVLKRKGMDWVLRVDQKPYDVVFEHLPWPISIIKLPWMKRTIYVEW